MTVHKIESLLSCSRRNESAVRVEKGKEGLLGREMPCYLCGSE